MPRWVRDPAVEAAFAAYVDGRTIAVVGPAAPIGDQAAEIDGHDVVIRISAQYPAAPEYGSKRSVAQLNAQHTREFRRLEQLPGFDWYVTKTHPRIIHPRVRQARVPPGPSANQVTLVLHDLAHFDPAAVTVYGADLYLAGPAGAYHPTYGWDGNIERARGSHLAHDQLHQRTVVNAIRRRKGWPSGDARYLEALDLDDREYARRHRAVWSTP